MVNKFLLNYKLLNIDIYNLASDFSLYIYSDNKENIWTLQNPKFVNTLATNPLIIHEQIIDFNSSFIKINEHNNNILNKFDKKNKNNLREETTLDIRKNKGKLKKKNPKNINLDNDDLFINKNNNPFLSDDSLNISLIKTPKINKQKKKYKINNDDLENSVSIFQENMNSNSKNIIIDSPLTIEELALKLSIHPAEIITWLFLKGISVTINQVIDISIATKIAINYEFNILNQDSADNINYINKNIDNKYTKSVKRPPIITIFGHVDHGKTTLLDSIRNSNLVKQERGGITQNISAYEVEWLYESSYEKLIFLDTPGHEAFSSMRSRGAQVTDIAILVVAADDGLKPQSIEAIKHILNRKLPYIIVINKIDKPGINILKIKQELAEYNIINEKCDGSSIIIEVSALTGQNIDILLSNICLMSQLNDFIADPDQLAKGIILEAYINKQKGTIANVVVQNGTLKISDFIISGNIYGKIKGMISNYNLNIKEAKPSSIVEILGFPLVPQVGANFEVVKDEKEAKKKTSLNFKSQDKFQNTSKLLNSRITLESYNNKSYLKQLNIILKTDNQGSLEAIISSFTQISQEKVQINILSASSGSISYTDIELASTSNSLIVCFNINISSNIYSIIKSTGVMLRSFNIIYDLLDDITNYMLSLVDPEYDKIFLGRAKVQTVFYINKGAVAGCFVDQGKLKRLSNISIYRDGDIIYNGVLNSLKRIKDDIEEIDAGGECGVMCKNYNLWKKEDIIEAYELKEKEKVL
uniref:Translation initiation factor IF-2, chloroplastic n=1 Tax=Inkyuleea mariana TaxID=123988 RepID=A0A4D6X2S9_9FLOR|nr:Translation initiation factor 2 [Inkyuleea mariana]